MTSNRLEKQDPRYQYPRPPFDPQPQSKPGLSEKMDPEPDCGETSYVGSGKMKGRKALVTGGDSGIGRATAIAFAREGADVAINHLESESTDAKDVIELIEKEGRKAIAIPGDIRDESFCKTLVEKSVEGLGGLDVLVNNAATQLCKPSLTDIKTDEFDSIMKTNLYALFWITKAAIPYLEPGASVINVASIQAYDPSHEILVYAMTKAAIVDFTKGLAIQLMKNGVRVNAVAPGPFWTPIQPTGSKESKVRDLGKSTTFGRPGQPVECAPLFVLLASQDGSYMNGEILGITGGAGIA
jgi:NAD(P)-dependent dehydrogenase (short-subunit alcohol dehydrogenase family)